VFVVRWNLFYLSKLVELTTISEHSSLRNVLFGIYCEFCFRMVVLCRCNRYCRHFADICYLCLQGDESNSVIHAVGSTAYICVVPSPTTRFTLTDGYFSALFGQRYNTYEHFTRQEFFVRYQVYLAAGLKMAVFWVVAPCSMVEVHRRFRDACCLHRQSDHTGSKHFWNVGKLLSDCKAEHHKRPPFSTSLCFINLLLW
jgi:hypothetical protein